MSPQGGLLGQAGVAQRSQRPSESLLSPYLGKREKDPAFIFRNTDFTEALSRQGLSGPLLPAAPPRPSHSSLAEGAVDQGPAALGLSPDASVCRERDPALQNKHS